MQSTTQPQSRPDAPAHRPAVAADGSAAPRPTAPDRFTDARVSWYRSPVDGAALAALMRRSDARGWLQTLLHLGWFATTALVALYLYEGIDGTNWVWRAPLLAVALFVHGTMGPFMGLVAIHELQHRTVFESRALNAFFERVYAFISWSDYVWYEASHPRHHMATCHRAHDGEIVLPQRFSLRHWQVWLALLAWNPATTWAKLSQVWRHARGRIDGEWNRHVLPESNPALRRRHRNWARTLLAGHAALALLFVLSGHGFLMVVFTFGTFYCSWLGFLCGLPQHYGLNADVPDFRRNTRTFTCGWLPAFYYWNMQYHLEHHMYPAVPFHQLPKLRALIAHDLPPAPHGLRATWRGMLAIRDRMRADPAYRFEPPLPPYGLGEQRGAAGEPAAGPGPGPA